DENDTLNRITFSTDEHPELVDYQNADPSGSVDTVLLTDLNNDEINDIIAVSSERIIYFIDGFTGLTLYTNTNLTSYSQGIITDVVLGDFDGDVVPDVAVSIAHQTSTVDYGGQIFIIDGSNGELITILDQQAYISDLEVEELTGDATDDLVAGLIRYDAVTHINWVANVSFINGATGAEFLFFDNHDDGFILSSNPLYLSVADFDDDSVLDVVLGVETAIYFIDGSNGQVFYNNTSPIETISGVKAFDVGGDSIPDVVVSAGSSLYFIDGTDGLTLFNNTDASVDISSMTISDFNEDTQIDIIISTGSDLFFVEGSTGISIFNNTDPVDVITSVIVADFNLDLQPDVLVGTTSSTFYVVNSTDGVTNLTYSGIGTGVNSLVVSDLNNDTIIDVISGSQDGTVYFKTLDFISPILSYTTLPELPTVGETLEFVVYFSEPNLDFISINYLDGAAVEQVALPTYLTSSYAKFTIVPPSELSTLEYWFYANDTWYNELHQGSETDPYELQVYFPNTLENTDPISHIGSMAVADFNNDGVPDVAASSGLSLYFIDGSTGSSMFINNDSLALITQLETGYFNNDTIPDVAGLYGSAVILVNGQTGISLSLATNFTGESRFLFVEDFDGDGYDDFAVGHFWSVGEYFISQVSFFNGGTGQVMYRTAEVEGLIQSIKHGDFDTASSVSDNIANDISFIVNNGTISTLYLVDGTNGNFLNSLTLEFTANSFAVSNFNDDITDDIVVGSTNSSITFFDGSNLAIMHDIEHFYGSILLIELADIDKDGIEDIVAASDQGQIILISGKTGEILYVINYLSAYDFTNIKIVIGDITKDGVPDLVVYSENWDTIFVFNGVTGKVKDEIYDADPISSSIILADFDQNGVSDILYGTQGGTVKAIQSLTVFTSLFPILKSSSIISQGEEVNIKFDITNIFNDLVINAEVHLVAQKAGSDLSVSFFGEGLGNGSYIFTFRTGDWPIGNWYIFPIINRDPYDNIDLSDYIDINGIYQTPFHIQVIGICDPLFTLSSKGSNYNEKTGVIEEVVEGNNITLEITVIDRFYHDLSEEEVDVTIRFAGINYTGIFVEDGKILMDLSSVDLKHGSYDLEVTISGEFVSTSTYTLTVQIIPQFPELDYSFEFLLYVASLSFVLFFMLITGGKSLYKSIDDGQKKTKKKLSRSFLMVTIVLGLTLGASTALVFLAPVWGFLTTFAAFGVFLVLFFFWFFDLLYSHLIEVKFEFNKKWIMIIVYVILIFVMINFNLIIASQIEWFDYYISLEYADLSYFSIIIPNVFNIPKIYWDLGVVGFSSGFLVVVVSALYETYSDVKRLEKKKEEIKKETYEKQMRELRKSIAIEAKSTFRVLARNFVLWYGLIAFTFISSFEIYEYMPIFAAVVAPALLLTLLIIFRGLIFGLTFSLTFKVLKQALPFILLIVTALGVLFGLFYFSEDIVNIVSEWQF
ncbi:MAG: FG-GAP repeat domain-containing protein, partial [Candidatus Kariarchaeaceae archaeon]